MGIQQDPIQVCGHPFPVSFFQMLASVLVFDDDGAVLGLRTTIEMASEFCGCNSLDCDKAHLMSSPETMLVSAFGLDGCGKLALKLIVCDGSLCTEIARNCDLNPQ